jgi:hypothetical protein
MTRIPNTTVAVSYAYTVKANGKVIGTVQGFNPTANRNLERVREILNEASDLVEIVPGRTEFSITLDRLETYNQSMMEALGFASFEDISQVTDPIQIVEEIRGPASLGNPSRTIVYERCWIQTWGKTIREGTITVTENVTLWPEQIISTRVNG